MRKTFLFSLFLLVTAGNAMGQFVEVWRSARNRRPPSNLTAQIDGFQSPTDVNFNGSPDIIMIWNDTMLVIQDGGTAEIITNWSAKPVDDIYLGSFTERPGNPYSVTHVVGAVTDKEYPLMWIHDLESKETVDYDGYLIITMTNFVGGDYPEILAYDANNRQAVLLAHQGDAGIWAEPVVYPAGVDATAAYSLSLLYESEPGRILARRATARQAQSRSDLNGDGIPEIVVFVEDDEGNTLGMVVFNAATQNVAWEFPFPEAHLEELRGAFHGFFDVDADGVPEAYFGNRTVVTREKTVHEIAPGFEIVSFLDLNGDDFPEVLGRNRQDSTVQIWTRSEVTNTTEALASQLDIQIAPNPFQENSQIRFVLDESARVQLDIFDIQGRQIARLIDDRLPAGPHQAAWRPAAWSPSGGIWFYRLAVNGTIVTGKMVQAK